MLGFALNERDALGQKLVCGDPGPGCGEHLRALIDSDDLASVASDQALCDQAGARGHVEHPLLALGRDRLDHGLAPARVLPEAEGSCDAIVVARQRGEQLERFALAAARLVWQGPFDQAHGQRWVSISMVRDLHRRHACLLPRSRASAPSEWPYWQVSCKLQSPTGRAKASRQTCRCRVRGNFIPSAFPATWPCRWRPSSRPSLSSRCAASWPRRPVRLC